eukprot:g8603.t1
MDESEIVQNALKKSEDEDTIEIAEVTEEEETQAKSALEENILNKGKNAYYYAHAGNLGKGADKKNLGGNKKEDGSNKRIKNNITDYAWADGDKKVSIYITSLENLGLIDEDNINLETGEKSMKLTISDLGGEDYILEIPNLNSEIRKGKTKLIKAKNKLIVSLFKSEEFSWYDLRKE